MHLHVRSGFSFGFGVATPGELVEAAAAAGHRTLALTDRDGLQGIPRFLRAASVAGVVPIVGAEISVGAGAEPEGHVVVLKGIRVPGHVPRSAYCSNSSPEGLAGTLARIATYMDADATAGWAALDAAVATTALTGAQGLFLVAQLLKPRFGANRGRRHCDAPVVGG